MNLRSSSTCYAGNNKAAKSIAAVLLALVFAAPLQQAAAAASGVYVSGQGLALEQAFQQALADNPGKNGAPFWIIVAGGEIASMTKGGTTSALAGSMKMVRERGGLVYVCRSDMIRAGIKEEDLLEGVVSMYGYGPKDWSGLLPARQDALVLPDNMHQSQMILRTCAGEQKPL